MKPGYKFIRRRTSLIFIFAFLTFALVTHTKKVQTGIFYDENVRQLEAVKNYLYMRFGAWTAVPTN